MRRIALLRRARLLVRRRKKLLKKRRALLRGKAAGALLLPVLRRRVIFRRLCLRRSRLRDLRKSGSGKEPRPFAAFLNALFGFFLHFLKRLL